MHVALYNRQEYWVIWSLLQGDHNLQIAKGAVAQLGLVPLGVVTSGTLFILIYNSTNQ